MLANTFTNAATVKLFSSRKWAIVAFFAHMARLNVRRNRRANAATMPSANWPVCEKSDEIALQAINQFGRVPMMLSKNVKRFLLIAPLLVLLVLAAGYLHWYNPNFVDFFAASSAKQQLVDLHEFTFL